MAGNRSEQFLGQPRLRLAVGAALIVVMTLLAYAPALRAGFIWDDPRYVVDNVALRSAAGLWRIWSDPLSTPQYYPLAFTTMWVEFHLWGLAPLGYHLTNIVVHALNAVVLWALLRRLAVPGAFVAAAVFALHPVHVESVAWITERKDVLSALFALLSVVAWVRCVEAFTWRRYAVALALFVGALLSKTSVCILPASLLLLTWWKRPTEWRRGAVRLVPFLLIGVALALVTAWREHLSLTAEIIPRELSGVERVLVAGRALWFYAWTLVWPARLTMIYAPWAVDAGALWQHAFPVLAVAAGVILWLCRRRLGEGPLVAVLCFATLLLPALGFVDFDFLRLAYVADHLQYLASASLIALIVAVAATMTDRLGSAKRWISAPAAAALLLVLGTLSWQQARTYHDSETLWRDTLSKNPRAWMAHYNLGVLLAEQGKADEAMEHYAQALRIAPGHATSHNNLGTLLQRQGKLDEAAEHYAAAALISPRYADAYSNWGTVLQTQRKLDEAAEKYRAALAINPDSALAHFDLGTVLQAQALFDEAIKHYNEALRIRPDDPLAHYSLATALGIQGKTEEATQEYAAALRLKPDYAEAQLAWAVTLEVRDRFDEAIEHYVAALRIQPDYRAARASLERALARREERRRAQ